MDLDFCGKKFKLGSKTKEFYNLIERLKKKDAALDYVWSPEIKTREDLLEHLIQLSDMRTCVVCMMRTLHETIVTLYLNIIDNGPKPEGYEELQEEYPPNYTENMCRLKNIRIKDPSFTKVTKGILGFCPKEPHVRVAQLLEFPIQKFADDTELSHTLSELEYDLLTGDVKLEKPNTKITKKNILDETLSMRELLDWREKYLVDVCRVVAEMQSRLT